MTIGKGIMQHTAHGTSVAPHPQIGNTGSRVLTHVFVRGIFGSHGKTRRPVR